MLSVEGTGLQVSSLQLEPGRANDGDWQLCTAGVRARWSSQPRHPVLTMGSSGQRATWAPAAAGLHLSNSHWPGVRSRAASGVVRGFRGCLQVSLLLCFLTANTEKPIPQRANTTILSPRVFGP